MDFRQIKGIILDMDGVLWRGDQPIVDLPSFFGRLSALDLKCILATNNSTRSVTQYIVKLRSYGVEIRPEQIVNSSMAAAYYLKKKYPAGGPVFVVGEDGLIATLAEDGFYLAEENVLAVVAGLDRHLTYSKLSRAAQLIRGGAQFIGTNPDRTYPSPAGLTPGSGAVLAFIEAASDQKPEVMGKPEPYLFDLALHRMGLASKQVLAVGDRLDTDILGAQRAGCATAVVLTGVSSLEEVKNWHPAPNLILADVAELPGYFSNRSESLI